jgi:hypothetical protein
VLWAHTYTGDPLRQGFAEAFGGRRGFMSRVFLSHSSRDSRQAIAAKRWLIEQSQGWARRSFWT